MEQHRHAEDGTVILLDEPAAVEAVADAEATETVADAEVEIARINATRDVQIAKLAAKTEVTEEQSELERLRGEVAALREIVERVAPPEPDPEPEPPAPVIVEAPPEPAPTEQPPPAVEHKPAPQKKSGLSWF